MHTRVYQPPRVEKRPRRRRNRGRRRLGWLILIVVIVYVALVCLIAPARGLTGQVTTFAQSSQVAGEVSLAWPSDGAAAIGAAGYGVLAHHGSEQPLPTASTAKMLTALCVLSKHPLAGSQSGPTITMTQRDVDFYKSYIGRDGSVVSVSVGQKLTERQALEAMLLRSANNLADSLAVWAFGSLSAYSAYANTYATAHGLSDFRVGADASGFDPSTTSTAGDLVRLGEMAMSNTALAQIVALRSAFIPGDGTIYNTNNLLGQQGIVGIKTGNNDQDPGVYLFAARYHPTGGQSVLIIGAVMGAHTLAKAKSDSLDLLATAKSGFAPRTPIRAGDIVGEYTVPWSGQTIDATATQDITLVGWRGTPTKLDVKLSKLVAPAVAGTQVGTISSAQPGGRTLSSVQLADNVTAPTIWWRLVHPLKSWQLHGKN